MNDATPRQYRGSLVERAVAFYDLEPAAVRAEPVAPGRDPIPDSPAYPAAGSRS